MMITPPDDTRLTITNLKRFAKTSGSEEPRNRKDVSGKERWR